MTGQQFFMTSPKDHWFRQPPLEESAFVNPGSSREAPANYWSKNIQDYMHSIGEEEQFHFIHITAVPRWTSSVPKEIFLAHDYFTGENWDLKKFPASSAMQEIIKENHVFLTIQNTEMCGTTGKWHMQPWRTAAMALREHQRNVEPINCFMHWIRKPTNELQEMCNLWTLKLATGHSQCSAHLIHTHSWLSLHACLW